MNDKKKYILNLLNIPIYVSRSLLLTQKNKNKIENLPSIPLNIVEENYEKIEIKKIEKIEDSFFCNLFLRLSGDLFIIADFSPKNKSKELALLNAFTKKLGLSLKFEREFTFPLPILADKSKESAKIQLEKLIFWISQEHKLKNYLILSEDKDLFSFLSSNLIFSHTLTSMVENPELRKELWNNISCLDITN